MQEKQLRSGFTTGTCGAAAAKAAAVCLLSGERMTQTEILTPKGVRAVLHTEEVEEEGAVWFRVKKDAGDDPDVTHGAYVYASVTRVAGRPEAAWYQSEQFPHLYLTGGRGIGMVTRPGLACPVGKHAINPVPRQMMYEAVEEVCEAFDCRAPLLIRIQIPDGVLLAEKTFNPKLGITGGISVLGTSGIVEPMSEQALVETIRLEIHMKAVANGRRLILTPGNYGEACLREQLFLSLEKAVKCSNFIGEAVRCLEQEAIEEVLLVGHIGKLVKVAGGAENTHSRYGDGRMEILTDCMDAVMEGRKQAVGDDYQEYREQVLCANTTEEAVAYLNAMNLTEAVMTEVTNRIRHHMRIWSHGKVGVEVVTFSTVYGILGKSQGADAMIKRLTLEET